MAEKLADNLVEKMVALTVVWMAETMVDGLVHLKVDK